MRRTSYEIVGGFDSHATCPKCGHDDVGALYQGGCGMSGCVHHPERIDRACRRCRFEWSEAPKGDLA